MFVNENDFSKKSDESRANLNDMLFGCHCIRLSIKYSDVDILIIRTTTEPRQTHRKSNRCMARHSLIHQRVAQTHRHTQTQQDPPSTFNRFELPLSTRAHMLEPNATYATGTMVSVKQIKLKRRTKEREEKSELKEGCDNKTVAMEGTILLFFSQKNNTDNVYLLCKQMGKRRKIECVLEGECVCGSTPLLSCCVCVCVCVLICVLCPFVGIPFTISSFGGK